MVNKTGIITIEFVPDRQSYNDEPTRPTRKFKMATMYIKPSEDKPQFGCYSERGLMSYFMFVELPKRMGEFLNTLEFPDQDNAGSPFKEIKKENITNATIFSELDFGKQGFGCPDGAIYFENNGISTMILIEVKADESYAESCKKPKYNSTIKGQLELRWRMKELLLNKCFCDGITPYTKGNKYLRENELMRNFYTGNNNQPHDDFYTKNRIDSPNKLNSMRRLIINEKKSGVEFLINKMIECENRIYFLVISKDQKNANPFNTGSNLPLCYKIDEGKEDWVGSKKQFCWLPITTIEELTK